MEVLSNLASEVALYNITFGNIGISGFMEDISELRKKLFMGYRVSPYLFCHDLECLPFIFVMFRLNHD